MNVCRNRYIRTYTVHFMDGFSMVLIHFKETVESESVLRKEKRKTKGGGGVVGTWEKYTMATLDMAQNG